VIEFYPQIKAVHVTAVLASGTLFALRALAIQLGGRRAMAGPVRYFSYSVDTVLLISALLLMGVLHQYPLVNSWLTVKVALVVVYIVLGTFALKRGRTRRVRLVCAIAALLTFGLIVSIAVTHDPLGVFSRLAR
jgi:uncharacterized membrane protein SirB2